LLLVDKLQLVGVIEIAGLLEEKLTVSDATPELFSSITIATELSVTKIGVLLSANTIFPGMAAVLTSTLAVALE
jgi:hypothetical protein